MTSVKRNFRAERGGGYNIYLETMSDDLFKEEFKRFRKKLGAFSVGEVIDFTNAESFGANQVMSDVMGTVLVRICSCILLL